MAEISEWRAVSAAVDQIEDTCAVLALPDGGTLRVPLAYMPEDIGEGDTVEFVLRRAEGGAPQEKRAAKDVLNDILTIKKHT